MILKAIKSDKKMLEFELVQGEKSSAKVIEPCIKYEKIQNIQVPDETMGRKRKIRRI